MLTAKERRFATGKAIFRGYHPAIPLTVAYSVIFVTIGQKQQGRFTASTPGTIFNVAWATKVLLKTFFDEPVGG